MHRNSPRAVLIALIVPGALSLLVLVALLILMQDGPEMIVMQWSGNGASRYAAPAELLFLHVIAMAGSVTFWAVMPTTKPSEARLSLSISNGVSAILNITALVLLLSQLSGPATQALPVVTFVIPLLTGVSFALITFIATRNRPALS